MNFSENCNHVPYTKHEVICPSLTDDRIMSMIIDLSIKNPGIEREQSGRMLWLLRSFYELGYSQGINAKCTEK